MRRQSVETRIGVEGSRETKEEGGRLMIFELRNYSVVSSLLIGQEETNPNAEGTTWNARDQRDHECETRERVEREEPYERTYEKCEKGGSGGSEHCRRRARIEGRDVCSGPMLWVHARGLASWSDAERSPCDDACLCARSVCLFDASAVDVMRTFRCDAGFPSVRKAFRETREGSEESGGAREARVDCGRLRDHGQTV